MDSASSVGLCTRVLGLWCTLLTLVLLIWMTVHQQIVFWVLKYPKYYLGWLLQPGVLPIYSIQSFKYTCDNTNEQVSLYTVSTHNTYIQLYNLQPLLSVISLLPNLPLNFSYSLLSFFHLYFIQMDMTPAGRKNWHQDNLCCCQSKQFTKTSSHYTVYQN
jgi:hypothetical protein